jgi:hypothetical protein
VCVCGLSPVFFRRGYWVIVVRVVLEAGQGRIQLFEEYRYLYSFHVGPMP